jgi:hypothetical protein
MPVDGSNHVPVPELPGGRTAGLDATDLRFRAELPALTARVIFGPVQRAIAAFEFGVAQRGNAGLTRRTGLRHALLRRDVDREGGRQAKADSGHAQRRSEISRQ